MKDLIVLKDDPTGLIIAWEKSNIATKYNVLGKTDHFDDKVICTTYDNKLILKRPMINDYIGITIEYAIEDVAFEKTNTYVFQKIWSYDSLTVHAIKSYRGITLSYATKTIYDKYYIYEKENNKYNKIYETEDFQITSTLFKVGNEYRIEAYKKGENDKLELKAFIEDYTLSIDEYIQPNTSPKVSVVIPIYNCEFLLPRTLDSLLLSTLKEIELILINDGSTDNTQEIIDWYQARYPKVIKTKTERNGSVAKSRTLGLSMATAPYTFFMDHDDMVHPNMLELMVNCGLETDADFVMNKDIVRDKFDYTYIYFYTIDDPNNEKRYITKTYREFMDNSRYNDRENFYLICLWQHMAKTSIYRRHPMPDYRRYEDFAYTRSLFSYGEKFAFCMDAYYVWDKRIKNIRDTLTDKTDKEMPLQEKADMHVDSLFQFVHDGNPEKFDIMMRNALNDVYDFCKESIDNVFIKKMPYKGENLYMKRIYEYIMEYKAYEIPLIINDKKIYDYVKAIITIMNQQ